MGPKFSFVKNDNELILKNAGKPGQKRKLPRPGFHTRLQLSRCDCATSSNLATLPLGQSFLYLASYRGIENQKN